MDTMGFSSMAIVRAVGERVFISFPVGELGYAVVTSGRLSARFLLVENSLDLDEEVLDSTTGEVTHTIGQDPIVSASNRQWHLHPGRYLAYGVPQTIVGASTHEGTTRVSSTSTLQTPLLNAVKVEPGVEVIAIESDDSDASSPPQKILKPSPSPSSTGPRSTFSPSPALATTPSSSSVSSILPCLQRLCHTKGSRNSFKKVNWNLIRVFVVPFVPASFNGDVIFELPALQDQSVTSYQAKSLYGMERRYDGHVWSNLHTTNIKNGDGLTFRMSACVGHLRCENPTCDYLNREHRVAVINETEWDGCSPVPFEVRTIPPTGSTLTCKICSTAPSCVDQCPAKIYYVVGPVNMSRACVHFGSHDHPVKDGDCRESKERSRSLISDQVERNPSGTNSAIVLEASKEFLGEMLLRPEGTPPTHLGMQELMPVLEKCKFMSSPSIRNEVSSFKYFRRFGVMDSITKLRGCSNWAFVQENKFPGQGSDTDKVFVFKMSEVGPGSGVDLVTRMQPAGDLEDAWIMFDHVKRVKHWTTIACHVYDPTYCRVMTIAVCDMQSEDVVAQCDFWKNLNGVMGRHGITLPFFKGFMADSAQANWNAVRIVYGSGNPVDPLLNRERTCLFHWTQSMEKHTKADIRSDLQEQHRKLCKQYKDANSLQQAESRFHAIRTWWHSSGATTDEGLWRLELWLAFWHFRYRQWGAFMDTGLSDAELLHIPTCNLAETVHNKWMQQSGKRGNDLYVATVDDYVRAFMQMVRYYQFLKGENPGNGPGKEELLLRVAQRYAQRTGNPKGLNEAMAAVPGLGEYCTRDPHLEGKEVFGSAMRMPNEPLGSEHESHRPDKVNFSRPRVGTRANATRAQVVCLDRILEETLPSTNDEGPELLESRNPVLVATAVQASQVTSVQETVCDEMQWHIAHLSKMSLKACFALQAITRKKCVAKIVQGNRATAAPTYTGNMDNFRKNRIERMQFFFCNDDISRCIKGLRRKWVLTRPEVPEIWPIKVGTNLTPKEILDLQSSGFRLPPRVQISPNMLFGNHTTPTHNLGVPVPESAAEHPSIRSGKKIRRNPKSPTTKQANNCASSLTLRASVSQVTMVPHPGFGCIITLDSGTPPAVEQYMVTIGAFPECTCPYFKEMSTRALGKRGQWANCKHLYFLFVGICQLDAEVDLFIHAPSFSFNEVKRLLESGLLQLKSN